MEKQRIQIVEEMSTAGSESISNMLIEMDTHRVMINSEMEEEEYLFKLKGMKCFPRKDMTAISGGPKTGKTNWISVLLACALKDGDDRKVLDLERLREERLRVMWIDTEQSPQSTQSILKRRVCPMVLGEGTEGTGEFPEDMLFVFNIRSAEVDQRYDLIAEGVEAYHPDIVIIDNIRDLIHDINDGQKAQELIEKLMHMATQQRCRVRGTLHRVEEHQGREAACPCHRRTDYQEPEPGCTAEEGQRHDEAHRQRQYDHRRWYNWRRRNNWRWNQPGWQLEQRRPGRRGLIN